MAGSIARRAGSFPINHVMADWTSRIRSCDVISAEAEGEEACLWLSWVRDFRASQALTGGGGASIVRGRSVFLAEVWLAIASTKFGQDGKLAWWGPLQWGQDGLSAVQSWKRWSAPHRAQQGRLAQCPW